MTVGQGRDAALGREPLRVALIGYGLGGSAFHAPLIAATAGLHLAVVVTRDAARRAQIEHRYPDTRVVADVDALWRMSDELDLVVVSSPNATHVPYARTALEARLHVVVDKPFATRAAEARAIGALAERVGRLAIPFHNRRWDGDFLTVQRLVRDDALGEIHRFESRFERLRATAKPAWTLADAAERGEGIVLDIGTHLIDQALHLFGPVTDVHAELAHRHPLVVVEDEAFLSLAHASGVRSHLYMSAAAAQSGARFSAWGARAAYLKHGLDPQEDALRAGALPSAADWGAEPRERWGWVGTTIERAPYPTLNGAYPAFYAGVERAIRAGGAAPVLVADAVATLDVIEAAFRSAREQCIAEIVSSG